jgi:hypothetical protein
MMRRLAEARGERRRILSLRVPGAAGKALAAGGMLPGLDGLRGRQTFAQWLVTDAALSRSVPA